MTRKSIIKHKMTFTTPLKLMTYSGVEHFYNDSFNYRIHKNFWSSDHPLNSLYNKLQTLVPHNGNCDDKRVEGFRLVSNMHYDTYNNGTGNAHKWSISKEYKKAIRQLNVPKEVVYSLEIRLSQVFEHMGRGKNFGWVRPYCENQHMEAVEHLLTDIIYYTTQTIFPEDIFEVERIEDPYGERENLQLVKKAV